MRHRWAGLTVLLALLTACGDSTAPAADRAAATPSSAATSTGTALVLPAVPGIEAVAVQQRTDAAIGGQLQVRITDTGAEPFTVTAVAIESAGFAPLPPTAVTARYAPGQTIDLTTPFGAVVCDRAAEPAAAQVTLTRPDGMVENLRVPMSAEVLGKIHAAECAVLAVAEVVTVSVTGLRADGDELTGDLVLTRAGAGREPVRAARLERSVLVDVVSRLPIELAAGAATESAPLAFSPATCDPHVLAETKKPYVFLLFVAVGADEPVPVALPLDDGQRDLLAELVDRVCARG